MRSDLVIIIDTSTQCIRNMSMEKLHWYFGELLGKPLYNIDNPSEPMILNEWVGNKDAKVITRHQERQEIRRLSAKQAMKLFFKQQCESTKGKCIPLTLKNLASELLKRMRTHRDSCTKQRKAIAKDKKNRARHQRLIQKELSLQEQSGVSIQKDQHTIPSLEAKIKACEMRMEAAKAELEQLMGQSKTVFSTNGELLKFFEEMGVPIAQQSLSDWSNGRGLKTLGRPTALSDAAERKLMEVILYRDRMGMPMDRKAICSQALAFVADPVVRARFSKDGPTRWWFKEFLKRAQMENPAITTAITRKIQAASTLELVQKTPPGSASTPTSTPQRLKKAKITFSSLKKPRTGPWKVLATSTPTHEDMILETDRISNIVKGARTSYECNIDGYLLKAKEHRDKKRRKYHEQIRDMEKAIMVLKQKDEQLDKDLVATENALKQEHAQLLFFEKKLEEDGLVPNSLAIIGEKVEDLLIAERNEFGLPVKDSSANDSPLFDDIPGCNMDVLEDLVSKAKEGVSMRAGTSRKRPLTVAPEEQKKIDELQTTSVSAQLGIPKELNDIIVKMLCKNLNTTPETIYQAALSEESLKSLLEPADDPGDELKKEMRRKFRQRVLNFRKRLRKLHVVT